MSDTRHHGLDALRGIAALAVVIFHYSGNNVPVSVEIPAKEFLKYGVEVFFALSGFVIAFSLSNSNGLGQFVLRRFYRLYPMFWVCCLTTWLWVWAAGLEGRETSFRDLVGSLTMIQSLLSNTLLRGSEPIKAVDGVYWSLTCELLFYALAFALWGVFGRRKALHGFTGWVLLSFLLNVLASEHSVGRAIIVLLNAKWAGLFYAGIVLQAVASGRLRRGAAFLLLVANCTLTLGSLGAREAAVLCACTVAIAAFSLPGIVIPRTMAWLGAISYPLYLLHQNIGYSIHWKMHARGAGPLVAWTVSLSVALLLAHVAHRAVDIWLVPRLRQIVWQEPGGMMR